MLCKTIMFSIKSYLYFLSYMILNVYIDDLGILSPVEMLQ